MITNDKGAVVQRFTVCSFKSWTILSLQSQVSHCVHRCCKCNEGSLIPYVLKYVNRHHVHSNHGQFSVCNLKLVIVYIDVANVMKAL